MLCFGVLSTGGAEPSDELKAAIVLGFLHYTAWTPPPPADAPLTVGVFGRPAFVEVLRRSLEGKVVNNRPARLIELKQADLQCCQVIYFATDDREGIRPLLQALRGSHALTIGEANEFLEWGGAVNLMVIDGRMSFEVSLGSLQKAGIEISSRLLRFGQVRRPPKNGRTS